MGAGAGEGDCAWATCKMRVKMTATMATIPNEAPATAISLSLSLTIYSLQIIFLLREREIKRETSYQIQRDGSITIGTRKQRVVVNEVGREEAFL